MKITPTEQGFKLTGQSDFECALLWHWATRGIKDFSLNRVLNTDGPEPENGCWEFILNKGITSGSLLPPHPQDSPSPSDTSLTKNPV